MNMITEDAVTAAHIRQARTEAANAGCPHADMAFSDRFEAYYCLPCNIWLEPLCDDAGCPFCAPIPLRPT